MEFLGLGKTLFNSSVCRFKNLQDVEVFLTERLSRKKASGAWPTQALLQINPLLDKNHLCIYENRDVEDPLQVEEALNSQFPFFESLKLNGLDHFSRHFNKNIIYSTHHIAHAYAAAFMSPFDKCLILVIDGAGSRSKFFDENNTELNLVKSLKLADEAAEERSLYSFNSGKIFALEKKMQIFKKSTRHPEHYFSEGLGSFYEKISELIFNSKRSAGKVMGLAALGNAASLQSVRDYLENLNWTEQYKGKSKQDWEMSTYMQTYKNAAADAQSYFESDYLGYLQNIKKKYPDYNNIIITGGCALNCTSNMKLFNMKIFDDIYIPPFPGDESIGLGTAYRAFYEKTGRWAPNSHETQHGYFGPKSSVPNEDSILKEFKGFSVQKLKNTEAEAAQLLVDGHILAWFQDRSESGPRALGNRSILARPDKAGLKDHLNSHIKFRESFRPYGCSTLHEKAHLYFAVPEKFNNPYMSFASLVNADYRHLLKEVMHVDLTSRMQTVRPQQNQKFYNLINEFGKKTGTYCLLNTSLNIMGEPIVEDLKDAKNFLENVPVYGLIIDNFLIRKI